MFEQPDGGSADRSTRDMPMSELTARLRDEVRDLVKGELALAKVEGIERAKRTGRGVGMFGSAAMLGFFAACCGVAALVLGLSNVMRSWLAALVAGAALLVLAVFVALPGRRGFREQHPPVPKDSVESLKADAAAIREGVHR
ncbi:MAG TPA: phage holin family protein [Jatrophihabitans sp.]|nr:phage holin family protein [Jatrophihabitans sp.]